MSSSDKKSSKGITVGTIITCCVLVLTVGLVIALAWKGSDEDGRDLTALREVEKSFDKVAENKKYVISSQMVAPDGQASFLEVYKDGVSYTEFPASDSDTDTSEDDSQVSYSLSDWMTSDGHYYMYQNTGEETGSFFKMPKSYSEVMSSRNILFKDDIIRGIISFKKLDEKKKLDISEGNGEEEFDVYTGKMESKAVKALLGKNTHALYESIKKDYPDEENICKYADMNLEELDMSLTFSDAKVEFYVKDGMLRQFRLECGGLGSRLSLIKTVFLKLEYSDREEPDFSGSTDYIESIRKQANEYAKYDSYDEAIEAIYEKQSTDAENVSGSAVMTEGTTGDGSEEDAEAAETKKPSKSKESK